MFTPQFIVFAALFVFPGPFVFTRLMMSNGSKAAGGYVFALALLLSVVVWVCCLHGLAHKPMSIAQLVGSFVYKVGMVLPFPGLVQVGLAWAMPVREP